MDKYLKQLSKTYKNIQEVSEEIINLQAILNLPKGTELFMSDIHGEYEAFIHILNNGSGIIKSKIESIYYKILTKSEMKELATLIYYPEEKLNLIKTKAYAHCYWNFASLVWVRKTIKRQRNENYHQII